MARCACFHVKLFKELDCSLCMLVALSKKCKEEIRISRKCSLSCRRGKKPLQNKYIRMLPAIKIRSLVATGVKHIAFDFSSPAGRNANRQAG